MRQIIADFGTVVIFGTPIPLRIHGYGLMLALGFICSLLLARWLARRAGEDADQVSNAAFYALIGGVLGARLAFVFKEWEQFQGKGIGAILNVSSGGLIYFGGLIGGTALVLGYVAIRRIPMRRFIDIVAPAVMLGLAFGRAGCLLNGCCWGGPCGEDWALSTRFPMRSKPLVKLEPADDDFRNNSRIAFGYRRPAGHYPYTYDQGLSPVYSELYMQGKVRPDDRLLNHYDAYSSGEDKIPGPPRLIPLEQYHGPLDKEQLSTMFGPRTEAAEAFERIAGADGLLSRGEWEAALGQGPPLHGSELWDEAMTSSSLRGGEDLRFTEFWSYLQMRRTALTARFDDDGDGELSASQRQEADAYLRADMFALQARQKTPPRQPAQLLGILNALLLCSLLLWYYPQRRREGRVFALMLILYPITRFILESLRNEDALNVIHLEWTHNQITSLLLVAMGVGLWCWLGRLPASAGPLLRERRPAASADSAGG